MIYKKCPVSKEELKYVYHINVDEEEFPEESKENTCDNEKVINMIDQKDIQNLITVKEYIEDTTNCNEVSLEQIMYILGYTKAKLEDFIAKYEV